MDNSKASVPSHRKPQRHGALLLVAAAALFAAVPAAAHKPPMHPPLPRPDDISSVNQYVEVIPTTGGPKSVVGSRSQRRGLAPGLVERLRAQGGRDAAALARAAITRPDRLKPVRTSHSLRGSTLGALSAGAGAVVPRTGGSGALLALVSVLAVITAAALGAAFRRRRARADE